MAFQSNILAGRCANILPSPPASPSVYAYPSAFTKPAWYNTRLTSSQILPTTSSSAKFSSTESTPQACDEKTTTFQENLSHDGRSRFHSSDFHRTIMIEDSKSGTSKVIASDFAQPDQVSDRLVREDTLKQRSARAYSSASQPMPQLAPTETEQNEDIAGGPETLKSGAERLAEKRKMKRFRLTHAQTRYLTSEFSRQPHPDTAHRERLSRDIPGLNPRQVQVWFQNKRAKLKRMAVDDQERMRRSRALPEDFDFGKTLQPAFRECRPLYGTASTDPLMLEGPSLRLGIGNLSTVSDYMNSSFANQIPTPISLTGSTDTSPISPTNNENQNAGPLLTTTQSQSPQCAKPFSPSHHLSLGSIAIPHQGGCFSQKSSMGLGSWPVTTSSPLNATFNDTSDYGNLIPLRFTGTPFQRRDNQRFGRAPTREGPSQASRMGTNQHNTSPLTSPSNMSYNNSHILYYSSLASRAPSYKQGPDNNSLQGSSMILPGYQDGQQVQPHQMTGQRCGSESSQITLSQDPSVNRYDQPSYCHSGEYYRYPIMKYSK